MSLISFRPRILGLGGRVILAAASGFAERL